MLKYSHLTILLLANILIALCSSINVASAEQIALSSILPKLQAIHEDAQTLLIKNSELKSLILDGLKVQNERKLKEAKEAKINGPVSQSGSIAPVILVEQGPASKNITIDYAELEEFNKWVDVNLDYAVKNTRASIDAFKEEASTSNGNVDYSEQAIKDGIEGVKYWQSAVIFQDKTLKGERIDDD